MMNFVENSQLQCLEGTFIPWRIKNESASIVCKPICCTGMFLQSVPNYKEYTKIILTIAEECTSLFPKIP